MKTKFYLALALIAALITSSCSSSNNNDWVVSQTIPGCFSNTIDNTSDANEINGNLSVSIAINYTKVNSEVTITNIKLPDGSSFPQLKLSELPITQTEGWYIIKADNLTVDTGSSNPPTITNFELRLFERQIGTGVSAEYQPAMAVSFIINSKYTVYITRAIQYLAGTTNCTGTNDSYSTKETYYVFGIDPSKKILEIAMRNARFVEGMPKMNFNLRNINFTMHGNTVLFNADALIPYVGNTPNDRYPITRLSGTLDPIRGFSISFDCTPGSMPGAEFMVNANGTFTDTPTSEEN